MFKRIVQSMAGQRFIARFAGGYLHFVARTTRWRIEGDTAFACWVEGGPCIIAFWHETMPALPIGWIMARRNGHRRAGVVLASAHRDGQMMGQAMRAFGLEMAMGSSSRGGASGLRRLAAALKAGADVGLAPDGPRGPRRVAAAGVAQLAAISGAKVLPAAAWTDWALKFDSWDKMRFPLPFGRGRMAFGELITVPRHDWAQALPAIETALTRVTRLAEKPR